MTLGTSPRPGWTLSGAMTAFVDIAGTRLRAWRPAAPERASGPAVAGAHVRRAASGRARHPADDRLARHRQAAGGTIAGLPALHLAFLMATGAAAAALTLIDRR